MIKHLIYIFCIAFLAVSCSDTISESSSDLSDDYGMVGEQIQFMCLGKVPQATTRAEETTHVKDDIYEVNGFTYAGTNPGIDKFYRFTITMAKKGTEEPIGTTLYDLTEKETTSTTGTETTEKEYVGDGSLTPVEASSNTPLYWPDSQNEYGFHVVSNKGELKTDQNDPTNTTGTNYVTGYNFWSNDYLEGYGYIPGRFDVLSDYNYRNTNKWYVHNKMVWDGAKAQNNTNVPTTINEEIYKRIPLYLLHKRAWITIILKAGTGIERGTLYYENTGGNSLSQSRIYSKKDDGFQGISPWRQPATVAYTADKNGNAGTESSTALHAIVEPHNYGLEELLAKIVLNGQTFTYAPANDAEKKYENYNLEAGKHLVITANLTTDRIVLITAHLEDWEDVTYSSICDDYGQQGDPFIIETRDQLRAFLKNTTKYNKPGNIALISATTLNLEMARHSDENLEEVLTKNYKYPDGTTESASNWEPLPLYCTLNVAGCKISSSGQIFTTIGQYGSVINGTVIITGDRGKCTTTEGNSAYDTTTKMPAAICEENRGTIEQMTIEVAETANDVYATRGGFAARNYGNILSCSTDLEVRGTTGYLGGIAGESVQGTWTDENNNSVTGTLPIIDHCTVNGRVGVPYESTTEQLSGLSGVGGIVGLAENRVSYNTFNYGIPLTYQEDSNFKNIFQAKGVDANTVNAYNNWWPTDVANNDICSTNVNTNTVRYNAVLDCQSELTTILTSEYNKSDNKYRIARSFEVDNTWSYGKHLTAKDPAPESNIVFTLDGNNKTIYTNGKMLFTNIKGYIYDLNIYCNEDVKEDNDQTENTMSISPFAFSLEGGRLKNIKVTMAEGKKVIAPIPAGLVVSAYANSKIENCKVDANIQVKLKNPGEGQKLNTDMRIYCGGIVAQASRVTLSGCHFYGTIKEDQTEWIKDQDQHLFFRGGIVGGVVFENMFEEEPTTVINDCASWWGETIPAANSEKWSPCGSIVGSQYWYQGTTKRDGIVDGSCTGNWWISDYFSIGDLAETEAEKKIGRRNSIQPDKDQ